MIGFAMPWIFGAALAASLAITVLHFLSVRQPRVLLLPTARFVPERDARAVARQARPSDVPLLLLRVLALLAAGAALAGARCADRGARVSSIIVMDRALRADSSALVSRVSTAASVGDVANAPPPTVLWVPGVSDDPGVAIVAAIRESARQVQSNPSLAELSLTVVMPGAVRSRRAWDAWRSQWPASIRTVSADDAAALDTGALARSTLGAVRVVGASSAATTSDVVAAAFASRGALAADGATGEAAREATREATRDATRDAAVVVVHRASADDADVAGVTVQWPVNGVPSGWRASSPGDSVGAVAAAGIALVAPFVRTAMPPALSDSVRAIAWWSDGVPAAIERTRGTSCVRDVAITVADGSDLLLSPAADGLLRVLRAPCGARGVPAPREPSFDGNSRSGAAALRAFVPASRFREDGVTTRSTQPAWLAIVLLLIALAALLVEFVIRRASTGAAAS